MAVIWWILQIVLLLVVWKVVHLLFWNLRKMLASASLLLTMLVTAVIAILGVVLAHAVHGDWWLTIAFGVMLGLANGEYEYNRNLSN